MFSLLLLGYYFLQIDIPIMQNVAPPLPMFGSVKDVKESQLVSIARNYIKTNPNVYLGDKIVTWGEAENIEAEPENLDSNYLLRKNPS